MKFIESNLKLTLKCIESNRMCHFQDNKLFFSWSIVLANKLPECISSMKEIKHDSILSYLGIDSFFSMTGMNVFTHPRGK